MTADPEFSVITANFNNARYLASAIASLQAQTAESWEHIIVDDNSADESVKIAEQVASSDHRIRIVRQSVNRGPGAARNAALKIARGRWIVVFDADDMMKSERLETLRDRAEAEAADMIADNLLHFSDSQKLSGLHFKGALAESAHWIGLSDFIRSGCLFSGRPDLGYLKPLIRADLLRQSGISYDETLRTGEDYDLMARLLACGAKLRVVPEAHYLYRRHARSASHRIGRAAILALIEAHTGFAREIGDSGEEVGEALRQRSQSLQSMLDYDEVVTLLKSGKYSKAAIMTTRRPAIWRLLAEPVNARLVRLLPVTRQSRELVAPAIPSVL